MKNLKLFIPETITDEFIVNFYFPSKDSTQLLSQRFQDTFLNKYLQIKEYLLNRFEIFNSYKETILRIRYNIEILPTCPICGKLTKHLRLNQYAVFCSDECKMSLEGKKYADNKGKQTRLKKYGDENYCNKEKVKETLRKTHKIRGKEIKEKTRQTCLEKYNNPTYNNPDKIRNTCLEKYNKPSYSGTEECQEKIKQTCLERYNVENAAQSKEVQEKIKQTCLERYGTECVLQNENIKEKIRQTCLERYGVYSYSKTEEYKLKVKETCIKRYGVPNSSQSEVIKEKIRQTCLERYGVDWSLKADIVKEKIKQTNLIRYGYEYPGQSKEVQEKITHTCLERYGKSRYNNPEKRKETCLERYNKPSYSGTEECKEKVKQTCLERFGYEFAFYSPEIKEKIKSSFLKRYGVDHPSKSRIIVNKMLDTKRRNKTFNTSELEEKIYQWLIEIFSIENVIRQYKEERYPFCCDFYIKNLDVFIEVQGHWGHGLHPFDKNNLEDLALLEKWKDKSLESKYYEKVINAWTVRDPLKRETAKKSNLKYLELFDNKITKDELNALILSLKNT